MIEFFETALQFVMLSVTMAVAVIAFRIAINMWLNGSEEVKGMREEGGGPAAFWQGSLTHGQGGTRVHQGHGLHIKVSKGRRVEFEPKSKVV